ncbi:MAG TPA: NAD-dependent epimerase/dehydratase family protein [Candidatus Acidoferrales bacterium]|nr:NAD-dependent epimerase/dehydratase family protein [Candidatus Acidoferrales bacterium]
MKLKVIIFGATGMVGEGALHESLKHPDVESVLVIGRRSCNVEHVKLKEIIHNDFFNYTSIEASLSGYNACFFCLGISSVGMNEKDYTRITYDLTMRAATALSKLNPYMTFCYVSGAGTDSTEKGRLMWARVKGKTENDLMKLPFKATYMFRPGFIKPIRGLRNAYTISKAVGVLYPFLKMILPNYICTLEEVGISMITASAKGYSGKILESGDISELAAVRKSNS